jgi:integrase
VRKRADTGKIEIRWREGGRHRSRSFTNERDAISFRAKVQRARERGEAVDDASGRIRLTEFVEGEWWPEHVETLAPKTQLEYDAMWRRHIRKRLGGYRLRELTPAVVDRYRGELVKAGIGAPTIRKALSIVQGALTLAVLRGNIATNPVKAVKKPRAPRKRQVRPLAPAKVERIRAALLRADRRLDALLICVMAYAGLRPGEALALRWRDVAARVLTIEGAVSLGEEKDTKTGEPRTVELWAPLADDLERAWEAVSEPPEDALIFPRADGRCWTDTDFRNWRKRVYYETLDALGLERARPYDLRHSFASLLIHAGRSVAQVARQMGNRPSMTADTYAHVFDDLGDERVGPADLIYAARDAESVRAEDAALEVVESTDESEPAQKAKALFRTRTGDPLLTMEVLYQLS